MTKLNENEKLVYRVLNEIGGDYAYFTFAYISSACGLDRKVVRRVCRSLARKGFAEYGKGLFTEESLTAGSG